METEREREREVEFFNERPFICKREERGVCVCVCVCLSCYVKG